MDEGLRKLDINQELFFALTALRRLLTDSWPFFLVPRPFTFSLWVVNLESFEVKCIEFIVFDKKIVFNFYLLLTMKQHLLMLKSHKGFEFQSEKVFEFRLSKVTSVIIINGTHKCNVRSNDRLTVTWPEKHKTKIQMHSFSGWFVLYLNMGVRYEIRI